jgi:quercetin dioxygenase-like cupin family protein
MSRLQFASALVVVMIWIGSSAVAQSPGAADALVLNPIAAASGTGVSNVALINRDEIRVLRVDVAPGGVRNVHTHSDMQYHLFIPTQAGMQFEMEGEKPVPMTPWQAQFVKGGTQHGFKNQGSSTVTIVEIFVKK